MNNFQGFNQICSKHPHHLSVGVCGSCVRERLASLIDSIASLPPPPPPPDPPLIPDPSQLREELEEHEGGEEDDDDELDHGHGERGGGGEEELHANTTHGFHDMLASLPPLKLTSNASKGLLNHHHNHNAPQLNECAGNGTLANSSGSLEKDTEKKEKKEKEKEKKKKKAMMMMMMATIMRGPSSRGSFASESELNLSSIHAINSSSGAAITSASAAASRSSHVMGKHTPATPNAVARNHVNKRGSSSWFSSKSHVAKPKPLKAPHNKAMKSPPPPPPPHLSWILYSQDSSTNSHEQPPPTSAGKRASLYKADLEAISETSLHLHASAHPTTYCHSTHHGHGQYSSPSSSSSWLSSFFHRRKTSRSRSSNQSINAADDDDEVEDEDDAHLHINVNKVRGEEIDRLSATASHYHSSSSRAPENRLAAMDTVAVEGMKPATYKWDESTHPKQAMGYGFNALAYINKAPKKMDEVHIGGYTKDARGSKNRRKLRGNASPARSEDICMSRNGASDGHDLLGLHPPGLQRCKSVHVTRGSASTGLDHMKQASDTPTNNSNQQFQHPRGPKQIIHPHLVEVLKGRNGEMYSNGSDNGEIRNFPRSRSWGRRAWTRTLSPLWGLKGNNNGSGGSSSGRKPADACVDDDDDDGNDGDETPTTLRHHRRHHHHHHHHRGLHNHQLYPQPPSSALTPTHAVIDSHESWSGTAPSSATSYLSPLRRNNLAVDTRIHSAQ